MKALVTLIAFLAATTQAHAWCRTSSYSYCNTCYSRPVQQVYYPPAPTINYFVGAPYRQEANYGSAYQDSQMAQLELAQRRLQDRYAELAQTYKQVQTTQALPAQYSSYSAPAPQQYAAPPPAPANQCGTPQQLQQALAWQASQRVMGQQAAQAATQDGGVAAQSCLKCHGGGSGPAKGGLDLNKGPFPFERRSEMMHKALTGEMPPGGKRLGWKALQDLAQELFTQPEWDEFSKTMTPDETRAMQDPAPVGSAAPSPPQDPRTREAAPVEPNNDQQGAARAWQQLFAGQLKH